MVVLFSPRQGLSSAATVMTEQPFSGTALLSPVGKGLEKLTQRKLASHNLVNTRSRLGIQLGGRRKSKSNIRSGARQTSMYFGAWNEINLMDTGKSSRSERMTAIVGNELARYNIDIAALCETRLAETGDLTEHGAGYTFFWSGKQKNEPREAGVCFSLRTELVSKITTLPTGISDRLMTMRIPLGARTNLTLVSTYAPIMTYPEEEKEQFYLELSNIIRAVSRNDKLLILADFNARVGNSYSTWPNVLGSHGIGHMNSNGLLLLTLCAEEGLTITNLIPDIQKTTWMHHDQNIKSISSSQDEGTSRTLSSQEL